MAKILRAMPDYFHLTGVDAEQPLYLMLNLETTCSMRCPKCALPGRQRRDMGQPVSHLERERIMRLASQAGFKTIAVIGAGEPTENFHLIGPMVQFASKLGLETILFSTVSGLDKKQADFFFQNKVQIIVSLDSLDKGNYRRLTGNGDLGRVLENIALLRSTYAQEDASSLSGKRVVRLGINMTVVRQNLGELDVLKQFAASDMLFIANAPIRLGKFASQRSWSRYAGNDAEYGELVRRAEEASETKGPSSNFRGTCGYFSRGVAIDVDGAVLSCGYASETAGCLGHAKDLVNPKDLLELNRCVQSRFQAFSRQVNRIPSCPLRDPEVEAYIKCMRG
ncbi:MAG: radical SAM protein [Patescibacteria group bacterium]